MQTPLFQLNNFINYQWIILLLYLESIHVLLADCSTSTKQEDRFSRPSCWVIYVIAVHAIACDMLWTATCSKVLLTELRLAVDANGNYSA